MKAFQALIPHAAGSIRRTELGDSDFRVLEVLLHKGPLPVNTIGPKVWLTPGSISVAVDRLVKKGLVARKDRWRPGRLFSLFPDGTPAGDVSDLLFPILFRSPGCVLSGALVFDAII
jgi:MarR family transcriptional regulator, 2-MHQ and catechol-resistance regulon repressor